MGQWRRHAIYAAPPRDGPLARFGADWLGWDPEAGASRAAMPVPVPALAARQAALTAAPRRYGLHATLKAPFRLAPGKTDSGLESAVAALAARHRGTALHLRVEAIGGFVALVPDASPAALAALADACVIELDPYRAPLTPEEVARRGTDLDATAAAHLWRWGYPWVLDRFRFHLTLTGPLPPRVLPSVRDALARALAPLLAVPVPVADICRFGEAADGRFHLVARHPLLT